MTTSTENINAKVYSEKLKENGFVMIENVFSEEILAPLRKLVKEIVGYADKNLEDPFFNYYLRHRSDQGVLYDLFQRHPEFQTLARNSLMLDVLEGVLGKDIFMYENCLVYKPKGKRNEVPFHQDFINRPNEPIKYISWIALDDVTVENGAMKMIPGSHKNGFLPMYRVKGETHHDRIKPEFIDDSKAIHATMKAGTVLIFNQLVVHGSDRVNGDGNRRAYRMSFQGFEEIFTPRGTPIVLRGGSPASLAQRYNRPSSVQKKPFVKDFLHKVGKRLLKV